MKIAHLSDVHLPLLRSKDWDRRWDSVATQVRQCHPELVIITGDVLESAFPRRWAVQRLQEFVRDIAPQGLARVPLWFVPGNHDVKLIQGLAARQTSMATLFEQTTEWINGWREPVGPLHVFSVDSNYASWFARGKIRSADLDRAVISATCLDDPHHLHVFAMHHHLIAEPAREGESAVTNDERTLGLDDSGSLLRRLALYGFDVVLHGHRHLSTFHLYSNPRAEQRVSACWLVGAPSATKALWQGFNIINIDRNGVFSVSAVRRAQGAWLDEEIVASRDYEEARTRVWRRQLTRADQPTIDSLTVAIEPYQQGTEDEKRAQAQCGDILVTVTLHTPSRLGASLRFPLEQIVGYSGVQLRALRASWTDADGRQNDLHTTAEGVFDVRNVADARQISASAVLLNALPSRHGDWSRMQVSQGDTLHDPVDLRLAYPARFLRLRVHLDTLKHLQPVARERGNSQMLMEERTYYSAGSDASSACHQELMVFRPIAGIGYALTASGNDPVQGDAAEPELIPLRAEAIRQSIAQIETARKTTYQAIQHALDVLRGKIIDVGKSARRTRSSHPGDDISTDLLSVPTREGALAGERTGLRVVMTDSRTEARLGGPDDARWPIGVEFPWGVGIIGRSLRLGQWVSWTRIQYPGHRRTWPAKEWYYEIDKKGHHAHVYCGPLYDEQSAVAMLSISSHERDSMLGHLISIMRLPTGQAVGDAVEKAIADFAAELGTELAPAL